MSGGQVAAAVTEWAAASRSKHGRKCVDSGAGCGVSLSRAGANTHLYNAGLHLPNCHLAIMIGTLVI